MRPIGLFAGLSFAMLATLATAAPEYNPARRQPTDSSPVLQRLIVKMRPAGGNAKIQTATSAQAAMQSLAARAKINVTRSRAITSDMHVMQWEPQTAGESLEAALERLRADPAVEFAEPDQRRYPHAVPTDPLYAGQWFLQNQQPAASDAVSTWDITTGSNGVVIAVLDTGVRFGHPDLRNNSGGNRLLPGYDFVSADPGGGFFTANDGDGVDADPSDPGDWVSQDDLSRAPNQNCQVSDSSWHGTRVAGMIGALSNNSTGVAGMTWSSYILPVRVLGKCGGYDSDIITGMLWAAGVRIDGIPDNPYPARIENLSLGSISSCNAAFQSAVNRLTALGVLVVASAGNESGPVGAPANCNGVAAIAGLRHVGTKVGFSSLGPRITLSAPGGNCVTVGPGQPCQFSLDTTSNRGTTVPGTSTYTDQFNANFGTSFSAPIVSGIAGLMLAVNGNLKAPQLIARLQEGAKPFPASTDPSVPMCTVPAAGTPPQSSECVCTTNTCGAGIANAPGSVAAAMRPIAAVAVTTDSPAAGQITLDASGSGAACNRTITSYSWTTSEGSNPSGIIGADTARATVTAPSSGTYTVRLTVTDDMGKQDTADVVVSSTATTTSAPASAGNNACLTPINFTAPPSSVDPPGSGGNNPPPAAPQTGGGGGGGHQDLLTLLALALLMSAAGVRRAKANSARAIRARQSP